MGNILKMGGRPTKLDQMVAAGKLGKKSGEGFYVWKDGKPEKAEPEKALGQVELERLGRELVDPLIREAEHVPTRRSWRAPTSSMPASSSAPALHPSAAARCSLRPPSRSPRRGAQRARRRSDEIACG